MRIRSTAGRYTAAALLALGTTALGVLPACAATVPTTSGSPGPAQSDTGVPATSASPDQAQDDTAALTLNSSSPSTDYDHRTVDLDGTLTTADGTPITGAPISLREDVVFQTWNPWQDPIDPIYTESSDLGSVTTDAEGHFTAPGTTVDYSGQDPLFQVTHEVDVYAKYDPDNDPDTDNNVWAHVALNAQPVTSTVTYKVSKTKVHTGDTVTVSGTVNWPAGHGSVASSPVYLRAYYENQWNAQTVTDAKGHFSFTYKVRSEDFDFAVVSLPKDLYIAGVDQALPITHVS